MCSLGTAVFADDQTPLATAKATLSQNIAILAAGKTWRCILD